MALPPFRFFGGKGGVGKTTCAAAAALAAAESEGRRVLAASTDPAHSLGDALRTRLSSEPVPLPATRRGALLAAEVDVAIALDRWLGERRGTLRLLVERGTYLDGEDVDRILGLSLPGADELMGLLDLARLARESGAEEVVVDTAPTAHSLRLLAVPGLLLRFAGVLDALQQRHRELAERFGGAYRPDAADELIAGIEEEARDLGDRLRDPERASLFWVLLPEALSIAETRDALGALDASGIPVREVIVNRVTPLVPGACPGCQARVRAEREAIAEIREAFGTRGLRFLPALDREPRGLPALRKVARALSDPGRGEGLLEGEPKPSSPSAHLRRGRAPGWLDELAPPGVRLLLYGGKGGAGKTTCAAAAAILAAEAGRTVLLLSTDPAHSLADVLDAPLGDDERQVPHASPRLRARELDAAAAFEDWRRRHRGPLGGALGAVAGVSAGAVDRLLEIAPPGLDELVALSTILDTLEDAGPELTVLDTAPTGHALRLLEAPELALEWDRALLAILLKYRDVVGLGSLAEELVGLSRSLKQLLALLRNPARARFVAVTRAAELPRRETVRLLGELHRLSIAVPAVLVNAVPGCACPGQGDPAREIARLRRDSDGAIMTAPALFPPPRGAEALAGWARTWKKA